MHYSFHSTPTCTFKSRNQTITKQNQLASMPGPADYLAKKPLHQVATVAQTSQARNLYKTFQSNPGPGTYQPKSFITDGQKRSMSQRFLDQRKHTPGPTDYQIKPAKVLSQSPVFSLGSKSKSAKEIIFDHNSFKPAPTNYNTRLDLINKHGTVIGSSQRKDLTETQKTPAPNHYMSATAHNFASVSNPRCKIGEETRKNEFMHGQNTPGPAFYTKASFVEENSSKKKGFSCRQRVDNLIAQEISKFPAPGQYQAHTKNKKQAPQYTTTLTKRHTFMDDTQSFRKEFPGPGTHDPAFTGTKYRSLSANSFAKDVRKALDQNEKTPGPAEYNHQKKVVMNAAPKFSSTKTVAKNQFLQVNPENPGPGQYDPKESLIKPKLMISQVPKEDRPGFQKHRHTPGPGFYNLRGKEDGPTWRFPSQKRISFTDRKNQAKDGIHYEIASKVVDPPTYMRVNSKISLSPTKSMRQTGLSGR